MERKIKDNKVTILLIIFLLIFAVYVFFKHKTKTTKIVIQDDQEEPTIDDIISEIEDKKQKIKKKCKLPVSKFDMNGSKCQSTKVDLCKLGSYKQCTNNRKPLFKSCDCHEPNSILCDDNDNISEQCLRGHNVYDLKKPYKDNKNNTRVNMFHSAKKTVFDKLK